MHTCMELIVTEPVVRRLCRRSRNRTRCLRIKDKLGKWQLISRGCSRSMIRSFNLIGDNWEPFIEELGERQ